MTGEKLHHMKNKNRRYLMTFKIDEKKDMDLAVRYVL